MGAVGSLVLALLKLIFFVWGFHTNWLYSIFSNPELVKNKRKKTRSMLLQSIQDSDTEATFVPCALQNTPFIDMFENEKFGTIADIWDWSLLRYGEKNLFGTREVLEDKEETQPNKMLMRKKLLGEYKWITYRQADNSLKYFGLGLRALGQRPNHNICIFAETRAEWMISAQACFRHSFPVVTIYTHLGMEGILHCLEETEVEIVITSHDLLPKFRTLLHSNKVNVKTIIYMENPVMETDTTGFREDVKIISFKEVWSLGENSVNINFELIRPTPETTAIILYTSGSTGTPKGVVHTHQNIVAQLSSVLHFNNPQADDLYIAYLPLAHVMELTVEMTMVVKGVGIGYSHPNTLVDNSTMVKNGCKGDAIVLRPTIIVCVPLVLERLYKGITENIGKKSSFVQRLMEFCIDYKTECSNNGQETPIMDQLIFGKIRKIMGGRVRAISSGGAPLLPETHTFIRTVFGVILQQGYGQTETGCGTSMDCDDHSTGRVGHPSKGTHLRLVNWEEGNYKVTDKPFPRGEIFIGGDNVALGYLKLEDKTKEEFFTDENSRRWFKTGDIGQVEQDGALRIIDRKKDLVKLQNGEYVGLGKVESVLKACPVVANVCVFGNSMKSFVVALISPHVEILSELALKSGNKNLDFEALCKDGDIVQLVLNEIMNHGRRAGLLKFEIPAVITLTTLEWTPSTGLTTAAMKLKRLAIQKYYQDSLDKMYG